MPQLTENDYRDYLMLKDKDTAKFKLDIFLVSRFYCISKDEIMELATEEIFEKISYVRLRVNADMKAKKSAVEKEKEINRFELMDMD